MSGNIQSASDMRANGVKNSATVQERFTFQRMGGMDQATLATDYDWRHLGELDPKLWMALSCPIAGLEFNQETLILMDTDEDGRIRAQEAKDAVAWLCERMEHPAEACKGLAEVRLDGLRRDTDGGRAIAAALRLALKKLGKNEAESITATECGTVLAEAINYAFNGDGIVTLQSARESAAPGPMEDFIAHGLAIVGAKKDASGLPGLDRELAAELQARAKAVLDWRASVRGAHLPLGENTGEAWTLLGKLGPKYDDFFGRCSLAAYAPETASLLNEEKTLQAALGAPADGAPVPELNEEFLRNLPLGRVNAAGKLNLTENINPAWAADIAQFLKLFAGHVPDGMLTAEKWQEIKGKFAEYASVLDKRPSYESAPDDAARAAFANAPQMPEFAEAPAGDTLGRAFLPIAANAALEALADAQLQKLAGADAGAAFAALVQQDEQAPPLAAFQDLHKLALYNGHLHTFLMNFLSFLDFYNLEKKAIFQSGTLYLDSRSCKLCVPVDNIDAHAALADPSFLCIIYCQCSRKETDGAERQCHIAAALTAGHLAGLLDGRHGLFIDNAGKEWDTRIVRIVHNPVSIGEAVWSPYIRIGNMASQQLQKFISAKDETVTKLTGQTAANIAQGAKAADKGGFDFAKGAGIFAAVSVALSVVSAAFAYIAHSLASLGWLWPLAIVGVFLCISTPSVLLAWLKLRKRSLGPFLDASGWAVNKGAPINLTMGASLTSVGKMPPNAHCNMDDPYSLPGQIMRKKWKTRMWVLIALLLLLAAGIGGFILYCLIYGEPVWLFGARAFMGI